VDPVEESAQVPVNFVKVGKADAGDLGVYIKQSVYKDIARYAAADKSKERGGVLLGGVMEEEGRIYIVISGFIEGKNTDDSETAFTFGHETWDYVFAEQDRSYSDDKILGWQHTSPNNGALLSSYDTFIHETFFSQHYQVLFVIDPVKNKRAFYRWRDGRIEMLSGFYVYDDPGTQIKIARAGDGAGAVRPARPGKMISFVLCLLIAFSAFAALALYRTAENVRNQEQKLYELEDMIRKQGEVVSSLREAQSEPEGAAAGEEAAATVKRIESLVAQQQLEIEEQRAAIEEAKELAASAKEREAAPALQTYTVKSGDSLTGICERLGIDYRANVQAIMAINGIVNTNAIYAGQVLLLPAPGD